MKKLLLIVLFLLLGFNQAQADITHIVAHNLTTGGSVSNGITITGASMNGTQITAGATVTSDSVYETGSQSFGYSALALQAYGYGGVNPQVKITYQTSYDNINWFSPVTTSGNGTVTSVSTLDTSAGLGNTWVVYNYTVYPYTRFNFQNNSATTDTITAETMWQDYV